MMVSVGERRRVQTSGEDIKVRIHESISRVADWLEANDYRAYDPFDGLNAKFLRPFTFNYWLPRMVLQQAVRRFPVNIRPLAGVTKNRSTKGMGFLAKGFMRLHAATGDIVWRDRADSALQWLIANQSPGYSGACWGNHFDYQSRSGFMAKGTPTVVWTSLIGHAFLDAYSHFQDDTFLNVADSACQHIIRDLEAFAEGDAVCISYVPGQDVRVHNANTLGASLLARTHSYTGNESYRALAGKAIQYTAQHQRADGSWYYGEKTKLHWVDNFHTGYVLDCFKHYIDSTGDMSLDDNMMRGYTYWKNTFFLDDGTPRYYNYKTLPLDIQCCSQAIDTLVLYQDRDPESLSLASKVAEWTIDNMQDPGGHFYYRRYSKFLVNKTPTLHWGQATMLCALAGLYKSL